MFIKTTIEFIQAFATGMLYTWPVWIFLILVISVLGLSIGRREKWSRSDSLYYAFITATTVGYGDFRPKSPVAKFLAIVVAFAGLVFTGFMVAIALHAAEVALKPVEPDHPAITPADGGSPLPPR